MYRLNFILLVFVITFLGCSDPSNNEESQDLDHIIPKEKMIEILADVQITEAQIDELRKSGYQTNDSSLFYFEKLFKKHEITPLEFEKSLLFYKKDLIEMNDIYADVITRLNELKAKNEEIIFKIKQDSIKLDSIIKAKQLADSLKKQNDTIFVSDSLIEKDTSNITP